MKKIKNKNFLITGGTGFLGKNLIPYIEKYGGNVDYFGSSYDLSKNEEAHRVFSDFKKSYDYIIHAAVLQGAGDWPLKHQADQFDINTKIHSNILECWHKYQPNAKFIGIGSSCSYPGVKTVLYENEYWDGPMHESVDIYGLTKKVMNVGIEAYKSQYGLQGTTVVFATLYGPHDSFDREKSHVVSALIRKFVEAKDNNHPQVEVWGDGTQTRELIYVEDQIKAMMSVIDYNGSIINIGTGVTHTIKDLAENIKSIVDYQGEIYYNTNRFVGIKHKVLNVDLAKEQYGWMKDINPDSLENNLTKTINWFNENKHLID